MRSHQANAARASASGSRMGTTSPFCPGRIRSEAPVFGVVINRQAARERLGLPQARTRLQSTETETDPKSDTSGRALAAVRRPTIRSGDPYSASGLVPRRPNLTADAEDGVGTSFRIRRKASSKYGAPLRRLRPPVCRTVRGRSAGRGSLAGWNRERSVG